VRVLLCNSFFYERGGAETSMIDLMRLLVVHGDEVVPFAMDHPENRPTEYAKYFPPGIDYPRLLTEGGRRDRARAAVRVVYNAEARRRLSRLLSDVSPDIAHVHGIAHELSPAVLGAFHRHGVPVVQTLHDFKIVCPNTSFVSHGSVCERCSKGRYYPVVVHRCKRGSMSASIVVAIEAYVHRLLRTYERNVDAFIAPSRFLYARLRSHGFGGTMVHLAHPFDASQIRPCYQPGGYFVYVGRLVDVKGVRTLLAAMRYVRRSKLYVIGDGELSRELAEFASERRLTNVEFLGRLPRDDLLEVVARARFSVVPSEGFENSPMTVLESFAAGTPVLATNLGALPEFVVDGQTGMLVEPRSPRALARAIQAFLDNDRAASMGREARAKVERDHDPEEHYRRLHRLYRQVGARSARGLVA
jgi:glycosyltransferase involved in cell wall biosynthesis